jgi:hypothetical protein
LAKETTKMTKAYSLHLIALKAGASGLAFERFFCEAVKPASGPAGMTVRLLKGDRGERRGGYLLMFEIECDERLDRPSPAAGPAARKLSDAVAEWMGAMGPTLAKWNEYATPLDMIYTDYREV